MIAAPLAEAALQAQTSPDLGVGGLTVAPFAAARSGLIQSGTNALLPASAQARVSQAVPPAPPGMTRIAGDAPVMRLSRASRPTRAQQRQRLTITVVLRRTRQAGFNRYLKAVYDPHSPQHDRFLTQAQLATRFGPSLGEYDQLRTWLRSKGLYVTQTAANRMSLTVRGTRASAERAFGTPIVNVRMGRRFAYENATAPALPRALASHVQAIMGLSDGAEPAAAPTGQPLADYFNKCISDALNATTAGFVGSNPGGALSGLIYTVAASLISKSIQGLLIEIFASATFTAVFAAYCISSAVAEGVPVSPTLNPGGHLQASPDLVRRDHRSQSSTASENPQKIGLLEFDTYRPSDVTDWLNLVGASPADASRLSEVGVNGGVQTPGAGESEVLIDIDAVLGAAESGSPSYVVYDAPPSTSFVQMFQAMISGGDTVISNSWSQCEDQTPEADAEAIDSVLAEAAASGITVLNGTGDDGSACLDGSPNTVGVPADSPNSTAVGGTNPTFGLGLTYGSESYWDDQNAEPAGGAGGFGTSRYFDRPAYQNGLTSGSMRSIPDLSFDAEPAAGIGICQADAGGCPDNLLWGGTSVATPMVAAQVAELNISLGHNVGNLDAALYPLAGTAAFHTAASMGSDFAHVGLGSPNFEAIYQLLSGTSTGPVSAAGSSAGELTGDPQANGTQEGIVRVDLEDANGLPVGGKAVTLTPDAGSDAVVSPGSVTTDATDGAAVFTVTDSTAETVTFTVTDTTDNVTLSTHPTLTFLPPVATGAQISADQTSAGAATVTVYLQNAQDQPAAGKSVTLSASSGNTSLPSGGTETTGADGEATFSVTDSNTESVSFTATDVTDGNLPVPGSATVNFGSTAASCPDTLPSPISPYSAGVAASGFPFNAEGQDIGGVSVPACLGVEQPAFDASGNMYLADVATGQIFELGPGGGQASESDALPDTNFGGDLLGSLAFGKDGSLYASLIATGGSFSSPEIVQLDPSTGAIERVVATSADGLNDCPSEIATDPVSGDLFATDDCNFGTTDELERIENPSSADPTITSYATLPYTGSFGGAGIAFSPDGTIYVAMDGSSKVVAVTGTNGPATPVVTTLDANSNNASGVAVAGTNVSGQATALYEIQGDGTIVRLALSDDSTVTSTTTVAPSNGAGGASTSPQGCVYLSDTDRIVELDSGSGCTATSTPAPALTLSETNGSATAPTGSSVGLTASLSNDSSASGTPVHFEITGPNLGVKLVDADGSGDASFSYAGIEQGIDTITAFATVNGTAVTSAPVDIHWTAGKDTSYLSLDTSQQGGPIGQATTLTANLTDITPTPATPIVGASVTLSLDGQTCSATTDSSGDASCSITPTGAIGLDALTASYAGDSTHTAATASNDFELGGLGLPAPTTPTSPTATPPTTPTPGSPSAAAPVNTGQPVISGTPQPQDALTCSSGSWSNGPTMFAYQWNLGGKPIAGATSSRYVVAIADEAGTLTCTVTASNGADSAVSTSAGDLVAVPGTLRCPKPTGKLSGRSLGPLRIGMSRTTARRKLKRFGVTRNNFDNFCLYAGFGIRVGYPSSRLLRTLPGHKRAGVQATIILALTANRYYGLRGVMPGATLTAAKKRLKLGKAIAIGRNDWYLIPGKRADEVLKVQKGEVLEIGLADTAFTKTRAAQRRFLSSFTAASP